MGGGGEGACHQCVGRGRVRRGRGRGFDLATADGPPSLPLVVTQVTGKHTHTGGRPPPPPQIPLFWAHFYPQTRTNARRRVYSSACIGTLEKRGFQACDQGSKCRHAPHPDRPEQCLKTTT